MRTAPAQPIDPGHAKQLISLAGSDVAAILDLLQVCDLLFEQKLDAKGLHPDWGEVLWTLSTCIRDRAVKARDQMNAAEALLPWQVSS